MFEVAASCKDIARAPVTNWEPHGVTLTGYCYAVRHGMKVQLVITALRYAVTLQVCTHRGDWMGCMDGLNTIMAKTNFLSPT